MNKIRKGDDVIVLAGRDKGKRGKVALRKDDSHLLVEGVNIVKKHTKPNPTQTPQGGVIEREAAIDVSNVMLVCPACGQPTRVGFRLLEGGGKTRTCRRANCGKDIDKA